MKKIDLSNLAITDLDGKEKKINLDDESRKSFANVVYFSTSDQGDLPIAKKMYESAKFELNEEEVARFKDILELHGKKYFTAVAQIAINNQLK